MNVLIGDFLGDESIEQPGCKLRIFRFFRNERSSGLDRQKVKFPGRCSVIEPANRFTRDTDWVDGSQPLAAAFHSAHDLVHVSSLKRSIPLANLHLRARG